MRSGICFSRQISRSPKEKIRLLESQRNCLFNGVIFGLGERDICPEKRETRRKKRKPVVEMSNFDRSKENFPVTKSAVRLVCPFFLVWFRTRPRTFCGANEHGAKPKEEIITGFSTGVLPCEPLKAICRLGPTGQQP